MIIENSEIGYSRDGELVFGFITGVAGFPIGPRGEIPVTSGRYYVSEVGNSGGEGLAPD
jgi:hypothetical protein